MSNTEERRKASIEYVESKIQHILEDLEDYEGIAIESVSVDPETLKPEIKYMERDPGPQAA